MPCLQSDRQQVCRLVQECLDLPQVVTSPRWYEFSSAPAQSTTGLSGLSPELTASTRAGERKIAAVIKERRRMSRRSQRRALRLYAVPLLIDLTLETLNRLQLLSVSPLGSNLRTHPLEVIELSAVLVIEQVQVRAGHGT
jgi:hypothetical protein